MTAARVFPSPVCISTTRPCARARAATTCTSNGRRPTVRAAASRTRAKSGACSPSTSRPALAAARSSSARCLIWASDRRATSCPSRTISRLTLKPKHYDSRVLGRRIRADVREVRIERNDGPALTNANRRDVGGSRPAEPFVEDRLRIMSASAEQPRQLARQVLVQLESQAELLSGHRDHALLRQFRGVARPPPGWTPG